MKAIKLRVMLAAVGAALAMGWGTVVAQQPGGDAGASASAALRAPSNRPKVGDSLLLDMANAGKRVVAVGENGTIALSDDNGASFRRAKTVPAQATLNSVSFVDERRGWAAGHLGVILATEDGGETWRLQREDAANDQPLFDVFFTDANNGLAVGLWSLILRTTDGGQTWQKLKLPGGKEGGGGDRNLFHVFPGHGGALFLTAEFGGIYRSDDGGANWRELDSGYKGSLWTGTALPGGALLVGGLRGTLLRSEDGGTTWKPLPLEHKSSITSLAVDPRGGVLGSGLDGLVVRSADGRQFTGQRLDGRPALTGALVSAGGADLLSSKTGVRTAPRW